MIDSETVKQMLLEGKAADVIDFGERAIDALVKLVADPNWRVAKKAREMIYQIGPPAVPVLVRSLKPGNEINISTSSDLLRFASAWEIIQRSGPQAESGIRGIHELRQFTFSWGLEKRISGGSESRFV